MSHFAKVDQGIVINVIVAEQDFVDNLIEDTPGRWIQTSYNTRGGVHYDPDTGLPSDDQTKALRKNFAYIGGVYDFVRDAFYEQQPFPSWTLDEDTCIWEPPVAYPSSGDHTWNEETQSWDAVETE
jgi:hypothetical protein